jgi:hypothetical protein
VNAPIGPPVGEEVVLVCMSKFGFDPVFEVALGFGLMAMMVSVLG